MANKGKRKSKTREPSEYDNYFEPEDVSEELKVKYKAKLAYILNQDEVNTLINASTAPYVDPPQVPVSTDYPTYSEGECLSLINGTYSHKSKRKK